MNAESVVAGTAAPTVTTNGLVPTIVTGLKSFTGSKVAAVVNGAMVIWNTGVNSSV